MVKTKTRRKTPPLVAAKEAAVAAVAVVAAVAAKEAAAKNKNKTRRRVKVVKVIITIITEVTTAFQIIKFMNLLWSDVNVRETIIICRQSQLRLKRKAISLTTSTLDQEAIIFKETLSL